MQVCTVEEGDTWMTPYRRYLADGIPIEIKKKKRMRLKLKMLKDILAHHPFYLKGLQGAKLKS